MRGRHLFSRGVGFAFLLVLAFAPAALALPPDEGRILAGATEQRLWVAQSTPAQSRVFSRGAAAAVGAFSRLPPLADGVRAVYPAGQLDCYVFMDDGAFMRGTAERWTPEINLPLRSIPLDAVPDGAGGLFALVASDVAQALPQVVSQNPTTTQPFEPAGAPLSVVRYERGRWLALTACPPGVTQGDEPRLRPRLCAASGQLVVAFVVSGKLRFAQYDPASDNWREGERAFDVAALRAFWTAVVQGRPLLVAETESVPRGVVAYQLPLSPVLVRERPLELLFPEIADDARLVRYDAAFGFNQQLGLLGRTAGEVEYIHFASLSDDPSEAPLRVRTIFSEANEAQRDLTYIQSLTVLLPLVLLALLLAFRRRQLLEPAALPSTDEIAGAFQRLAGFLVDFSPFVIISALVMDIPWAAGLKQAYELARSAEIAKDGIPPWRLLLWWSVASSLYALYSLLMELFRGRTLGKMLVGTRVLSVQGRRPEWWRLVVRNLLRIVELLPQTWILGFLIVLSRNRQRVGDIFAGTVVTRAARKPPPVDE